MSRKGTGKHNPLFQQMLSLFNADGQMYHPEVNAQLQKNEGFVELQLVVDLLTPKHKLNPPTVERLAELVKERKGLELSPGSKSVRPTPRLEQNFAIIYDLPAGSTKESVTALFTGVSDLKVIKQHALARFDSAALSKALATQFPAPTAEGEKQTTIAPGYGKPPRGLVKIEDIPKSDKKIAPALNKVAPVRSMFFKGETAYVFFDDSAVAAACTTITNDGLQFDDGTRIKVRITQLDADETAKMLQEKKSLYKSAQKRKNADTSEEEPAKKKQKPANAPTEAKGAAKPKAAAAKPPAQQQQGQGKKGQKAAKPAAAAKKNEPAAKQQPQQQPQQKKQKNKPPKAAAQQQPQQPKPAAPKDKKEAKAAAAQQAPEKGKNRKGKGPQKGPAGGGAVKTGQPAAKKQK